MAKRDVKKKFILRNTGPRTDEELDKTGIIGRFYLEEIAKSSNSEIPLVSLHRVDEFYVVTVGERVVGVRTDYFQAGYVAGEVARELGKNYARQHHGRFCDPNNDKIVKLVRSFGKI